MKRYPSIFNDALAPVTPGPSSSNTCGPARIARTCRRLFGEKPTIINILMSNKGNYKMSFQGMRTDLAFLSGFLDRDVTDPRFINAFNDAKDAGITMKEEYTDDLPGYPTALAVITIKNNAGKQMKFHTVSCGGGAFYIDEVDDCKVNITGDCYETIIIAEPVKRGMLPSDDELKQLIPGILNISYYSGTKAASIEIKSITKVRDEVLQQLEQRQYIKYIACTTPVHPVVMGAGHEPPFTTSIDMDKYVKNRNIPMWKAALEYESAVSGWTEDEVYSYAVELWEIVLASIKGGLSDGNDMNGITNSVAPNVQERFNDGSLIPLGAINSSAPKSLAIMEYSNCSGVVVCIPTAGSSGIVPATIIGAADAMGKSQEDKIRAFLVSGLMGVFMEKTHYLGSYGCQMEVGLACGMAAAGLISLLGGTVSQACSATVMCLQSMSGLLCDKIAGLVQVPCLSRNMTATAIAMVCANATMAGVETLVPLEEKLDSMMVVGKKLIDDGINRMGDMGTPTGRRLAEEQKARNAALR